MLSNITRSTTSTGRRPTNTGPCQTRFTDTFRKLYDEMTLDQKQDANS